MAADVTWKIGGEAGFGIMSAGTIFAKVFSRVGYHVAATNEYPSLIRGGNNVITVRIAVERFESLHQGIDILVGLNAETVALHKDEVTKGGVVVFDPQDREWTAADVAEGVSLVALPLAALAKENGGDALMRNTVAIGASLALTGGSFTTLTEILGDLFGRKGAAVVDENVKAAKSGYDYVKDHFAALTSFGLEQPKQSEPSLVMNVSEAVGLGALEAGMKFAAIYPMTPINALISLFADRAKEFGIVYKQPEDEIAGMNMAIGASIGGARSMVASSGGGFALMVEGLSLAGITEVPLVIDLGMRPGPATGMPTWTEQGELWMAVHAGHGEFPRIILAPGDARQAYDLTIDAFELADKFQTPVFVLTDKYLNESLWCVEKSAFDRKAPFNRGKLATAESIPQDGSFKRYDLATDDGVSVRSLPGMPHGHYIANSYEHDEQGFTTEEGKMRVMMADKRMKKTKAIDAMTPAPTVYGPEDADLTFVSWGSTKGPVLEAIKLLAARGVKAKLIHFTWVYPLSEAVIAPILSKEKRLVDVENNGTGQLASLLREQTGITITEKLLKYDGRQWYPEEIAERLGK